MLPSKLLLQSDLGYMGEVAYYMFGLINLIYTIGPTVSCESLHSCVVVTRGWYDSTTS